MTEGADRIAGGESKRPRTGRRRLLSLVAAAAVGAAMVPIAGRLLAWGARPATPVDVAIPGTLADGDAAMPQDGSWFDDHPVEVAEGWRIEARLDSDDFDAWLQLFGPDGEPLAQNDDAGPGTMDAALDHVARKRGRYTLRANSRDPGMKGAYVLHVRAGPPTVAPPAPD